MAGVRACGEGGMGAGLFQFRGWNRSPTCGYLQSPASAFNSLDLFRAFRVILDLLGYSLYLSKAPCSAGQSTAPELRPSLNSTGYSEPRQRSSGPDMRLGWQSAFLACTRPWASDLHTALPVTPVIPALESGGWKIRTSRSFSTT